VQTFGATYRLIPYFLDRWGDEWDKTEGMSEFVRKILYGQVVSKVKGPIAYLDLRNEKDAELSNALDKFDMAALLLDGIKSIVSAADFTEGKEIFVNMACNIAMAIVHDGYNGDAGGEHNVASARTFFEDALSDLANLGITFKAPGIGTAVTTAIDVIAGLDYIIEGLMAHDHDVTGWSAYDEIKLEAGPSSCVVGEWTWHDDRNCNNKADSGLIPETVNDMLIMNDGNISMYGLGQGEWKLQGNTIYIDLHYVGGARLKGSISEGCNKITGTFLTDDDGTYCWNATKN
jgi:hypothetical protein